MSKQPYNAHAGLDGEPMTATEVLQTRKDQQMRMEEAEIMSTTRAMTDKRVSVKPIRLVNIGTKAIYINNHKLTPKEIIQILGADTPRGGSYIQRTIKQMAGII